MMSRRRSPLVAVVILTLTGAACMSQGKFLDSREGQAVRTAVSRAHLDMDCPSTVGQVLSREVMEPPIRVAALTISTVQPAAVGEERGVFTVGVKGCGQQQTYQVLCPMGGDGCVAAEGGRIAR